MKIRFYCCVHLAALLVVFLTMYGCAFQSFPLDIASDQFKQGETDLALATLNESKDEISSKDKLLELMSRGLLLQNLQRWQASTEPFLKAAQLIEEQERTSVSELASTLVVNEWAATYKGEYSERLWVHSYQMMNYLLLNQAEKAAVEARRALKVFSKYTKPLKNDWFSRALIALSFEMAGQTNDAYIEYRKLYETYPQKEDLSFILHRLAYSLGFSEQAEEYKSSLNVGETLTTEPGQGELILFIGEGFIPKKISGDLFIYPATRISWPQYKYDGRYGAPYFSVQDKSSIVETTTISSDLSALASASLSDRGLSIATKQIARVGVKHAIVDEVGDSDALAGGLLQVLFFVLEEADTRGWDTLPASLSMVRIPLEPGQHSIRVNNYNSSRSGGNTITLSNITIKPGQRIFKKIRF